MQLRFSTGDSSKESKELKEEKRQEMEKNLKDMEISLKDVEGEIHRIRNVVVKGIIKEEVSYTRETITDIENQKFRNRPFSDIILAFNDKFNDLEHKLSQSPSDSTSLRRGRDLQDHLKNMLKKYHIEAPLPLKKAEERPLMLQLSYQQQKLEETNVKSLFDKTLDKIAKQAKDNELLDYVYICHAATSSMGTRYRSVPEWIPPFLETLRAHLRKAGIIAILKFNSIDFQCGTHPEMVSKEYISRARSILLIGTPLLLKKHSEGAPELSADITFIRRARQTRPDRLQLLPIMIDGESREDVFPPEFHDYCKDSDWGNTKTYFQHFRELLPVLYRTTTAMFEPIWEEFLKQLPAEIKACIVPQENKSFVLTPTPSIQPQLQSQQLQVDDVIKRLDRFDQKLDTALVTMNKTHEVITDTKAIVQRLEDKLAARVENFFKEFKSISFSPSPTSESIVPVFPDDKLPNDNLVRFYSRFKTMLSEFVVIAKLIDEKKITPEQKDLQQVDSIFVRLVSLIPLPYIGLAAQLLTGAIESYDLSAKKSEAKNTTEVFTKRTDVIHELALRVTCDFRRQIRRLSEKGVDTLAECSRKRLIYYVASLKKEEIAVLTSDESKIVEKLRLGVIQGKSGVVFHTHLETLEAKDKKWTDNGVFRSSGLETPDYGCYVTKKDAERKKVNKYGFHFGDLTEKTIRGYTEIVRPPRPSRSAQTPS